jgi:two-component sensor histidine kinase
VTNAFKHAFNHSESGVIRIEFYEKEHGYYLSIKDNGSGFKDRYSNHVGMTIIDALATIQLEGTLKKEQKNGTKIEIEWEKNDR